MSATRQQVLGLYKNILRAASKWDHYGFREYTKIRARDAFQQNKGLTNQEDISKCIKEAQDNLGIFRSSYILISLLFMIFDQIKK